MASCEQGHMGYVYQHKRIKVYFTLRSCFCTGSNLQYVYHREHLNFIQFERLPFRPLFFSYLWRNQVMYFMNSFIVYNNVQICFNFKFNAIASDGIIYTCVTFADKRTTQRLCNKSKMKIKSSESMSFFKAKLKSL